MAVEFVEYLVGVLKLSSLTDPPTSTAVMIGKSFLPLMVMVSVSDAVAPLLSVMVTM